MSETGYIPRTLDKQEQFLLWEVDQFIIAVMIIGVGTSSGMMGLGIACGCGVAWQYGKLKAGRHSRFAVHLMYWWLPSDIFTKGAATPPSHQRYFLG